VENLAAIMDANARYAEAAHAPDLPATPSRRLVVVTCMDCRMNPYGVLGLVEGQAHVLRNAGGLVTDDILRSMIVSSNLLGTREAIVVMHTDCGMGKASEDEMRAKIGLRPDDEPRRLGAFSALEDALAESLEKVRSCPHLPDEFVVRGFVFDVASGRLHEPG
jgi:carbonic anhydrase